MKCFITFLFACTSYLANAQAIPPAAPGQVTAKPAAPISNYRLLRHQRVKPLAINPTYNNYRGVGNDDGHVPGAAAFIEMNRFAGYVLQYERTSSEKMTDGKKEVRNYEMEKRARITREGFSAAVNAIMQMNH